MLALQFTSVILDLDNFSPYMACIWTLQSTILPPWNVYGTLLSVNNSPHMTHGWHTARAAHHETWIAYMVLAVLQSPYKHG